MFTRIIQVWLVVIFAMPVYADDKVVCLGDNYEQGIPISNVSLPTVSLSSEGNVAQIYEGESLTLFANATVDTQNGGHPNFYWCAEKGQLEIDPTVPDLSQVNYIAPTEVIEDSWVRVVVQLSDSLGYVSGKSLFLNISPLTYYFVEGYIYNPDGHAISDALVDVAGHIVKTNADGYYKINELLPGNYTLTASKNDHHFAPIKITVGEDEPNKISVFSDAPEIQEPPAKGTYLVHSTIHDKFNKPIADVMVQVDDTMITSDSTGYWKKDDLTAGQYIVTASKEGYIFAPNTCVVSDNQEECQPDFKPESLLDIKVVAQPRKPVQGEDVAYDITVTNRGSAKTTELVLTDVLPEKTRFVSSDGQCTEETNTVICTLADLEAGEETTVALVVSNTQAKPLVNQATVKAEQYPADIQVTWTSVIPYLSVSLSDSPDPVTMGGVLHYTAAVDLSHYAPSAATSIQLMMQLPRGVELKSVETDNGICDLSNRPTIICGLTDLSIDNADDLSHITVEIEVVLNDLGLLLLTHEAKVVANEYPAHTDRARTKIALPDDVKVDIIFVIDVTGSMQEEINGIIKALQQFIAKVDPSIAPNIALVTFRDEVKVEAFTVTGDLELLLGAVSKLKASGGGSCPEASAEALKVAIPHIKKGGFILFATDASPYADADIEGVTEMLLSRGIRLNVMLTGDCSEKGSWNNMLSE